MRSAGKERVHLFGCCRGSSYYTILLVAFFGLKTNYGVNFRSFGFSIAGEYLGCHNSETSLYGRVSHLNGLHVHDFVRVLELIQDWT